MRRGTDTKGKSQIPTRVLIKGNRVRMRNLAWGDLPRCVRWLNNPELRRLLGRSRTLTLTEERRWFEELQMRTNERVLAIENEDGTHIGNLGLHNIDLAKGSATLGILIGDKQYWNQGYGSDAVSAALRFCFDDLGLSRVELDVLERNERAIRAYEKCGFQQVRVRSDKLFRDERPVRVLRMVAEAKERVPHTRSHLDVKIAK